MEGRGGGEAQGVADPKKIRIVRVFRPTYVLSPLSSPLKELSNKSFDWIKITVIMAQSLAKVIQPNPLVFDLLAQGHTYIIHMYICTHEKAFFSVEGRNKFTYLLKTK
jgi:hypothetical protein